MRRLFFSLAGLALTACAATEEQSAQPVDSSIEETEVYIQAVKPEVVGFARYKEPLRYTTLNDKFVLLEGRNGVYLIEFRRLCNDISSGRVFIDMADHRDRRGQLRSKTDTIRGCLIEKIYKLPQSKSDEGPDREDTNRTEDQRDEQQDDADK